MDGRRKNKKSCTGIGIKMQKKRKKIHAEVFGAPRSVFCGKISVKIRQKAMNSLYIRPFLIVIQ